MPSGRRRVTAGALIALIAFGLAPALSLPDPEPVEHPDIGALLEHQVGRWRRDAASARPAYLPEPDGPLTTSSPPTPLNGPVLVSKTAPWLERQLQYLVPDEALPFRYHVGLELARRFGVETVVEAMSQWDGIPGSRWATEFVSVVQHHGRHRPDGRSVVYLRTDCPPRYLGVTRPNSAPERAKLDLRYGAAALYTTQVDITLCEPIDSIERLRGVIAHEVGHVMGMAHLCEPGEICWAPEDIGHDARCRPMFYLWGPCREGVTPADHDSARHLYPTLPRLQGAGPVETAARASFATTWSRTADTVVVARSDHAAGAVLAAVLSGVRAAPLLLGEPDEQRCITRAAAEELGRAATVPATVLLVGAWPESCDRLAGWNLAVERIGAEEPGSDPDALARLSVAVATRTVAQLIDQQAPPNTAIVAPVGAHQAGLVDAAIAAAAAGRRGAPLLLTHAEVLSPAVSQWLEAHPEITQVHVAGDPEALAFRARLGLRRLGVGTVPLTGGTDPVGRAATLASRLAPPVFDRSGPVVVAPVAPIAEAAVAASVAVRLGAPLLVSGDEPDPVVTSWLSRHRPHGGYLVGGTEALPYPVQWEYSRFVAPAEAAVPSRVDAPRGAGWPRLQAVGPAGRG